MYHDSEPDTRTVVIKDSFGWVAGDFAMYPSKEHLPTSVVITYERASRDGSWRAVHAESFSLLSSNQDDMSTMRQEWHFTGGLHRGVPEWLDTLIKQYTPTDY